MKNPPGHYHYHSDFIRDPRVRDFIYVASSNRSRSQPRRNCRTTTTLAAPASAAACAIAPHAESTQDKTREGSTQNLYQTTKGKRQRQGKKDAVIYPHSHMLPFHCAASATTASAVAAATPPPRVRPRSSLSGAAPRTPAPSSGRDLYHAPVRSPQARAPSGRCRRRWGGRCPRCPGKGEALLASLLYPVLGICASSARPSLCLVHFDFSLRSSSSGLFRIRVSRFWFAVPLPHWLVVLYRCIDRFRCGLVRLV